MAAAAAVLLAVLMGASVAVWQARVALAEKGRAEEVKEFIASIFRDADPYQGSGKALPVVDLLKQAKKKIDRISYGRTELRVELLSLVGSSLIAFEDMDTAEGVVRQALDEARRGLAPNHPQTLHARLLMAQVYRFRGRTKEMEQELDQTIPALRIDPAANTEDLVLALENRGHLAIDAGDYVKAEATATEALNLAVARLGETHPRTVAVLMLLAEACEYGDKKPDIALGVAERAFRSVSKAYWDRPKNPHMIDMRQIYGRALARAGQVNHGIEEIQQATDDASDVFGPTSLMVGFFLGNLSRYQRLVGEIQVALENNTKSLDIHLRYAQADSFTYAGGLTARGVTLLAARRGEAALGDLSESADTLSRTFGPTHEETLIAKYNRALALAYLGKTSEAEKALEPVIAQYRSAYHDAVFKPHRPVYVLGAIKRLEGDHRAALQAQQEALSLIEDDPMAGWERMSVLVEIGLNQVSLERYDEAMASLEEARSLFQKLQVRMTPHHAETLVGLARVKMGKGRQAEALPLLEDANGFWRSFDRGNRWAGEAAFWLGRCYLLLDRKSEAKRALARADRVLSHSPIPLDSLLVRLATADRPIRTLP